MAFGLVSRGFKWHLIAVEFSLWHECDSPLESGDFIGATVVVGLELRQRRPPRVIPLGVRGAGLLEAHASSAHLLLVASRSAHHARHAFGWRGQEGRFDRWWFRRPPADLDGRAGTAGRGRSSCRRPGSRRAPRRGLSRSRPVRCSLPRPRPRGTPRRGACVRARRRWPHGCNADELVRPDACWPNRPGGVQPPLGRPPVGSGRGWLSARGAAPSRSFLILQPCPPRGTAELLTG